MTTINASPYHNGSFVAEITNYDGSVTLNISDLVLEVSIYYDLFACNICCDVVINDSYGLENSLPLVGDETLNLMVKANPNSNQVKLSFKVYKLSNKNIVDQKTHAYVLHGITPSGIDNLIHSVYDSFVDLPIAGIVSELHNKYLTKTDNKQLLVEQTDTTFSMIGSGQTPQQLIKRIAKETQSSRNPNSNFIYFEDETNFYFTTITSLYDQGIAQEYYLVDSAIESNTISSSQIIGGVSFERSFSVLESLTQGAYHGRLDAIDPILRKVEIYEFKYREGFDRAKHIDRIRLLSEAGSILNGEGHTKKRLLVSQLGKDYPNESYLSGKLGEDAVLRTPRRRQEYTNEMNSELQNLLTHTINITVPGNTNLKIGQLISIFIPRPINLQRSSEKTKYFKLYGKQSVFLITAMRHTYNALENRFVTVLTCSKESFGAEIKTST